MITLARLLDTLSLLLTSLFNKVSNCSPHNLTKRGSVEFVSCSTTLIGTIHPIALVRTGFGTSLGILDIGAPLLLRDSNPPYFCTRLTFEESSQRVFLLLTLTKLGTPCWNRTNFHGSSNRRYDHIS